MASSSTDLKPESSTSLEQELSEGFRTVRSVILCGASVRSLAQSAIAAGLRPLCVDFFEDADLIKILQAGRGRFVGRMRSFEELPHIIRRIRSHIPLLWAGGLENHTDVLRSVMMRRPVIGPDPEIVDRIRQPHQIRQWFEASGLNVPRLASVDNANTDCHWLRKPIGSSGGQGIRTLSPNVPDTDQPTSDPSDRFVMQEYIDGVPMSAVFFNSREGLRLVGTSLQLTGWPSLGASGFLYCGNVGPFDPGDPVTRQTIRAAEAIVRETNLQGVFGIDFILRLGQVWLIEVNPRLTASHMLYENPDDQNQAQRSLVANHLAAFGWRPASGTAQRNKMVRPASEKHHRLQARFILWARQDLRLADSFCGSEHETWCIADIPPPGSTVPAGSPLCSVHVSADSPDELLGLARVIQLPPTVGQRFSWPDISQQLRLLLERFQRNCQRSPNTSDQTVSS